MIRQLFLPSTFKGRRYFSESSLGISIEANNIRALLAQLTPSGNTINKVFVCSTPKPEKKEVEGKTSWNPSTLLGPLSKLKKAVGQPNIIRLAIPSSIVVLKELEMPFCKREKIRMIVEYEVEPLLPFPIQEAFVDFIVTSKAEKGKSCRIIVAVARKTDVEKLFEICSEAQLTPHYLSLDIFSTYSLAQKIVKKEKPCTSALLEVEPNVTKVALLENGALRFVRNIHRGANSFIEALQKEIGLPYEECKQKFSVYGVRGGKNVAYDQVMETSITSMAQEIKFALDSFRMQSANFPEISHVTLFQRDCSVVGIAERLEHEIGVKFNEFVTETLTAMGYITRNRGTSRTSELYPYLTALGTAIPHETQTEFDLGGDHTARASKKLIKQQLITGGTIASIIIASMALYGYSQLSSFSHKAVNLEKKAVKSLKSLFPQDKRFTKTVRLKKLSSDSQQYVEELESQWNNFGGQDVQPLEVILELITVTDKNKFNTTIDTLHVATNDTSGITTVEISGSLTTNGERAKIESFVARLQKSKLFEQLEFTEGSYDTTSKRTAFSAQMSVRRV